MRMPVISRRLPDASALSKVPASNKTRGDTMRNARPASIITAISLGGLLIAALYALMSMSYPLSLVLMKLPLSTQMVMHAVSDQFVLGDTKAIAQSTLNYTRAFFGISLHTALGGLALLMCTVQFVPAIRRRSLALHRAVGKVAVTGVALAMLGAIVFLSKTPAKDVFSGEPFAAALWIQAVSTLMTLSLAIKAIRERQIRAHMGWMALLFATLLTAPLLRIEYMVFGNLLPQFNLSQINAGIAVILMPQVVWLVSLWMQHAGQADMPLLRPHPTLHWPALRAMGWMGAATALHEGLLAPMGLDVIGHWRGAAETLPAMAALWAVPTAVMLPRIHDELRTVMRHQPIGMLTLTLGVAASIGSLLVASQLPAQDNNQIGRLFYWAGSGASGLALCAIGLRWRKALPVHTPARTLSLMSWLMPAVWAPIAGLLSFTGWPASPVITATLTLAGGFVAWHGFASAFGLPMPGVPAPASQTGESTA
jgi:hypothetical protein